MKFEDMQKYIQTFCETLMISGDVTAKVYTEALITYFKENNLSYLTAKQLDSILEHCQEIKTYFKDFEFSGDAERERYLNESVAIQEKIGELKEKYEKVIRENSVDVGDGLLYGITILSTSNDEKYESFKKFVCSQIVKEYNRFVQRVKYYIPDQTIDSLKTLLPEYWEQLKKEEIPSANEYAKYLEEREKLEEQLKQIESQIFVFPTKKQLINFTLIGWGKVEIKYE